MTEDGSPSDAAILEAVEANAGEWAVEIADAVGCSLGEARAALARLEAEGRVQQKDIGSRVIWKPAD